MCVCVCVLVLCVGFSGHVCNKSRMCERLQTYLSTGK